MKMNKYNNCINFLLNKNCNKINHSKSNFYNHLINTYNILKKWKQSEDLCYAGMFHNIYGNKYFNANLDVSREDIKSLIGEHAENLIFQYTNINRESIIESKNNELIILNLANTFEHGPFFKIEDNLYDENSAENVNKYFLSLPWTFSGKNKTEMSKKWDYALNFNDNVEKKFLELNNILIKKYGLDKIFKLKRAYASASTYGISGEYHIDDQANDFNEIFTVMFYLNNKWDIEYGGETLFLNEKREDIDHAVLPKPGRGILFDGFIYHGPRSLDKNCPHLRMVLTFKHQLINE